MTTVTAQALQMLWRKLLEGMPKEERFRWPRKTNI